MNVTAIQAFAAVRARLNAGSYPYPLYYHGDDPVILPEVPTPFAFVVFNNEGSTAVSFGGGRGQTVYRNRARVEAFVFLPAWQGLEKTMDYAETVAVRLRSYRDDSISCFAADVIPVGHGSVLSVPGLSSEVSNYQCAIVECFLTFDQDGGGIVDVAPPDTGGTAPDWVPVNAKIYIDLVGNRAWTETDSVVAIDTLLGSDPNTENGQNSSEYDPSLLTADGYICNADTGVGLAFIGMARAKVLDAATIVYRVVNVTGEFITTYSYFALLAADGHNAVEVDTDTPTVAYAWHGVTATVADAPNDGFLGAVNQIAATITMTRLEAALNGSAAVALTLSNVDRPSGNPLVAVYFQTINGQDALQSITIYDPLPDTTGLSALSEIT